MRRVLSESCEAISRVVQSTLYIETTLTMAKKVAAGMAKGAVAGAASMISAWVTLFVALE